MLRLPCCALGFGIRSEKQERTDKMYVHPHTHIHTRASARYVDLGIIQSLQHVKDELRYNVSI